MNYILIYRPKYLKLLTRTSSWFWNWVFGWINFWFLVNKIAVVFDALNSNLLFFAQIDSQFSDSWAFVSNSGIVFAKIWRRASPAKPFIDTVEGKLSFKQLLKMMFQKPGPHALPWGQPFDKFWVTFMFWYHNLAILSLK